jgi:hypothetical protein
MGLGYKTYKNTENAFDLLTTIFYKFVAFKNEMTLKNGVVVG